LIRAENIPEEALQSPEIQNAIKQDIILASRAGPYAFARRRDEWVQAGMVSIEEANSWIESKL
jgi:hypothetical protein